MEIRTVAVRWGGVVTLLKITGLVILVLVPWYHWVWHRPADLPPDVAMKVADAVPADADITTLTSQVTPRSYIAEIRSGERDLLYRVVYDRRSGECHVTLVAGTLDLGHILSWISVFLLASFLVLGGIRLAGRVLAPRCPICRQTLTREDTILRDGRRIGDLLTPLIMKATDTCPCGYTRSRVYTRDQGGTVDASSGMWVPPALRFARREGQITEDEWEAELQELRREHETPQGR